jgi:hypothetical protein
LQQLTIAMCMVAMGLIIGAGFLTIPQVAPAVPPTPAVPPPVPAPRFYYSSSSSYTSTIMTSAFSVTHDAGTVVYPDASAWAADTKTKNWNAAPLMNGTVGYWPLDEGTGTTTYDLSGNHNTGMIRTGTTWKTGSSCV